VRVFGADLLAVHVQLNTAKAGNSGPPVATAAAQPETPALASVP
jgi:hypothetical protein